MRLAWAHGGTENKNDFTPRCLYTELHPKYLAEENMGAHVPKLFMCMHIYILH